MSKPIFYKVHYLLYSSFPYLSSFSATCIQSKGREDREKFDLKFACKLFERAKASSDMDDQLQDWIVSNVEVYMLPCIAA